MRFNADTNQAKKELKAMMSSINEIDKLFANKLSNGGAGIGEEFKKASLEVSKFSGSMRAAMDWENGTINLDKLNKGLKSYNLTLEDVARHYASAGEKGVDAFSKVVDQINSAEVPLKKTNTLLDKFFETMQNTLRYEISTKIWYALGGAISSAYDYAQDLNKSLNNIRIVSGQSSEQMAKFAEQANKAAKALSSTTLDYTNAALIYAQQGRV